jgi:RNA polymerase sigma-70 factor (ECF subfamily)
MQESILGNWKSRAFDRSWQTQRERGWNLLYRFVGDRDCADDLCQEVAVRACTGYHLFRSDAATYTWLYRIAVNVVLRHRERHRPPVDSDKFLDGAEGDIGDPSVHPERALMVLDRRELVRKAINELPDEMQAIIVFSEYEHLKYREIAAILDVPIGTIKSRRHAANAILRKELSDYEL